MDWKPTVGLEQRQEPYCRYRKDVQYTPRILTEEGLKSLSSIGTLLTLFSKYSRIVAPNLQRLESELEAPPRVPLGF